MYIVNAQVAENCLCTGQNKAEYKSNEITVPADFIKKTDIEEAVVNIDAIGLSARNSSTDYEAEKALFLALKQNQSALWHDAAGSFKAFVAESIQDERKKAVKPVITSVKKKISPAAITTT